MTRRRVTTSGPERAEIFWRSRRWFSTNVGDEFRGRAASLVQIRRQGARCMTERDTGSDNQRRLAHERLSTGILARWDRFCASHPWRIVLGSLASIAVLIILVVTVGGSLKDEFQIPGSDTQKATDLIKAEFSSEKGSVLNLVFAAPKGERLDTPERKAAVNAAVAKLKTASSSPRTARLVSRASATRSRTRRSPTTDESRTRRRSSRTRSKRRIALRSSRSRTRSATRSSPRASPPSSTARPSPRPSSRESRSCSASWPRSSCS